MFYKVIDELDIVSTIENEKLQKEFTKDFNLFCATKENLYNNKHLFTPSSVGSCARCLYFKALQYPEDIKKVQPYSIRRLDMGTYMHQRTEDYLHQMANSKFKCISTEETRTCECFKDLGGTIDGILVRDEQQFIFEYKTINEYEFKNLVAPLPKHIEQATAYSLIFGIDKALFLYEKFEKSSNQDIKVFVINITNSMKANMLDRLQDIKEAIDKQEIPAADISRCKTSYCRYKDLCKQY